MEPWNKLREELRYSGYRKVARWTYEAPDGEVDYDIVMAGPSVCVLAITTDNAVVLAEQFRPGPGKVLLELPGGGIEKDEEPLTAMEREFLEETGYTGDFQFVGTDYISATVTQVRHNFVATNCRKLQEPKTDAGEVVEVQTMPLDLFRKHLRSGQMTDVSTGYLGLDYLGLLHA
jgi:ADP-ribose pyrophosphatase